MSSVQDMLDQGGSRGPLPSPASLPRPSFLQQQQQQQQQQNRVLACVMCQQRKVKCNRKFPCNNCIRVGASCVPATQNPRRRRRRFPERELLDRVRSYESLLRQHNVRFESLFQKETADGVPVADDAPSPTETRPRTRTQKPRRHDDDDDTDMNSDGEGARDARAASVYEATPSPAPGTFEKGNEAVQFRDRERHDDNDDDDDDASASSDDAEIRNHILRGLWQRQLGSTGSLFLRRNFNFSLCFSPHQTLAPRANLQSLHPGAAQIFLLWQTYLTNVDPLLKITHTPTLQRRIAEAANNLAAIDTSLEALLFSIYCAAVHSMAPSDCKAAFGSSKQDLLAAYHPACEQALLNAGFLRTSERECLSAFFLYMLSLGHHLDPRSTYAMLGVCTRLAKSMRLEQETANARLPPLEGELRRRLWWALVLFDARISELAQSPPVLDPTWDCRVPTNANDSDFRAEIKECPSDSAVQGKSYASEAVFAVVRGELGNAMRYMEYYIALSNPALRHMARRMPSSSSAAASPAAGLSPEFAEIEALETLVNDKYLQYCDPDNGLHFMTIWFARGVIAKGRLIKYFAKFSAHDRNDKSGAASNSASTPSSTAQPEAESLKDRAFDDALMVIKSDTMIMTSPLSRSYRWLLHLYFPMPAYIFVTQDLARRISGERAVAAWAAMHAHYEARFTMDDSDVRYMFKMFASTILQAWDHCEERCRAAGEPQPVPEMVLKIKAELAAEIEANKAAAASSSENNTENNTENNNANNNPNFDNIGLSTGPFSFGPVSTPSIFDVMGGGPGSAFASDASHPAVAGVSGASTGAGTGAGTGTGTGTGTVAGIYPGVPGPSTGMGALSSFGMPGVGDGAPWPPPAWPWAPRPQWGCKKAGQAKHPDALYESAKQSALPVSPSYVKMEML
ncbi:zinc c6 transcription factor [Ophiostoma piceae UAMH 11346]|uniref:Zinc c6 transcription factor n=1 Tax=Ophiostoma piceae (strain UAMH 11346) TaxID=1262450 RepID=S3CJ47_OPHP1|nr:zinc c6 transcription factor [Ophiostoma piceae UAMH 11346]